ncbi:hypothetical protein, partial [Acinetobacter guillouiae]|uniref:hypothetical protein n=1 Tax=Acinetobacter guillouiae TaxID=106649 RepID=UPI001C06A628
LAISKHFPQVKNIVTIYNLYVYLSTFSRPISQIPAIKLINSPINKEQPTNQFKLTTISFPLDSKIIKDNAVIRLIVTVLMKKVRYGLSSILKKLDIKVITNSNIVIS